MSNKNKSCGCYVNVSIVYQTRQKQSHSQHFHINSSVPEITAGQQSMTRQERHLIRSNFLKPTIDIPDLMTQHEDLILSLFCKKLCIFALGSDLKYLYLDCYNCFKLNQRSKNCFFFSVLLQTQEYNKYHDMPMQNHCFQP